MLVKPDLVLFADVFEVQVGVFYDRKQCELWIKSKTSKVLDDKINPCEGYSVCFTGDDGLTWTGAWIPRNLAPHKVAHECLHLAWLILDRHDVTVTVDNHEILAYLMDSLIEQYGKANRRKLH